MIHRLTKRIRSFVSSRGSITIETALVMGLMLSPMLLYGAELYSFKSRQAEMNRQSYSVAVALAATPDPARTDQQIIAAYRTSFPAQSDNISVISYCTCANALQSYVKTQNQNSCSSDCPGSAKLVWKKVTVTRSYEALVHPGLIGNATLRASNTFRSA